MTLPSKGKRTISLGEERYEWSIRRKPTYTQGAFRSSMTIAVQRADIRGGCVLVADAIISRPDNWIKPHQTSVTPAVVRDIIKAALSEGWQPEQPGSAFRIEYPLILDQT